MANLSTDCLLSGVSLLCLSVCLSLCWPPVTDNTDVNPLHCGHNRWSDRTDRMCLRWRRDVEQQKTIKYMSSVLFPDNGDGTLLANYRDLPFLVVFNQYGGRLYCTGSLIANQYVLTAARCVQQMRWDVLQFGFAYNKAASNSEMYLAKMDEVFIHDKYLEGVRKYGNRTDLTLEEKTYTLYGIAIIRLDTQFIVDRDNRSKINSICLPSSTEPMVTDNQHVMLAREDATLYLLTPRQTVTNPLLATITDQTTRELYQNLSFAEKSITDGSYDCPDDNGGPIFRYNRGRAVLVGVRIAHIPDEPNSCSIPFRSNSFGLNIRISEFLQWIEEKVKDSKRSMTMT